MDTKRTKQGYTLVELAIVLVIMGLIGTVFYNFIFQWIAKEKTNEAARVVATADKLLEGNLLGEKTGLLPSPETNTNPVDAEDGNLLPATLGVGNDPWGNRLRYFRANVDLDTALTTNIYVRIYKDAANFAADHLAAPNPAGGALPSGPTGKANADQLISNVAYVVLSLGPDGNKQYRRVAGSTYIDVLKPGLEAANSAVGGGATRFDDQFSYKTLEELKKQYVAAVGIKAGSSSSSGGASAPAGDLVNTPDLVENETIPVDGGGQVLDGQDVPDGSVIDLSTGGNPQVDLAGTAADVNYSQFTILGWFKTSTAIQDAYADVITIRQGTANPQRDRYTWWIGLWPTGDPAPGGWSSPVHDNSKVAGELVFMGSSATLKPEFIVDTNAAGGHYDNKWHFFAVVMQDMGGGVYQATLYADTISGATRTLHTSSTTAADWNQGPTPANPSPNKTYLGGGLPLGADTTWSASFKGYLDDIYIYDTALDSTTITNYYDAVKGSYPTN